MSDGLIVLSGRDQWDRQRKIGKKNGSEEMFQEVFHDTVTQIIKLNIIELEYWLS